MIKKYNVTNNGKLISVSIENYNDCRIKFSFVNNFKPLSRDQATRVMDIPVGQSIDINEYQIACKGTNYSFNEMRERNTGGIEKKYGKQK